ncbi:hypothetical protein BGZ49_001629 [Haplosporangium sp. Z 27]|nr:hypothetical protein BGZ49_001629 [Haplosporangium sp. Z 27]
MTAIATPWQAFFAIAISLLLSLSSSLIRGIDAQLFTPVPAWGSVSVFQEGHAFYVQGGSNGSYTIDQTFSIDLSTSWDTSNVPYRQLANGPFDYMHSSALLSNNLSWFVLSNGTGYQYNIALNSWTNLGGSLSVSRNRGQGGVTDPSSGFIYIPNAYIANNGTGSTMLFQYDLVNNKLNGLPMQNTLATMDYYSIAWSSQLKKMIVFGGATTGTNNVNNNMYTWDSINSWTTITPTGSVPTPRRSACMVSAYGGSKMILFGGLTDQSNSVLSDIYILDTATMNWTKGADAGVSSARAETSCAVTNDLFVSWGGGGVNTVITSNLTIIYNIKLDSWQSTYSPTAVTSPSSGSDSGSGSGSSTNLGAIIGGVIGGLVVIGLVIGFFVYRKKKNKNGSTAHENAKLPGANSAAYAPVSTTGPAYYEPWQQQQPVQPMVMAVNSSTPMQPPPQPIVFSQAPYSQPYTPYQPPIVLDYNQQQQQQQMPQIFQPEVQTQSYPTEDLHRQQSLYTHTSSAYSPQSDIHSPTVFGSSGSVTVTSPTSPTFEVEQKPTSSLPIPIRPPQNPQMVSVPTTYVDADSSRRNPQGH